MKTAQSMSASLALENTMDVVYSQEEPRSTKERILEVFKKEQESIPMLTRLNIIKAATKKVFSMAKASIFCQTKKSMKATFIMGFAMVQVSGS